jgi:hypothetical protein
MEDIFEEYGAVLIAAVVATIIGVGMFLLFKEGSPLAEWVHAYAKSLGG